MPIRNKLPTTIIKHVALIVLLITSLTTFSQSNLVIGFSNPYEDTVLAGVSANYDTLFILNNGKLAITNSEIVINNMLVATDSANLNITNSKFTANGNCVFYGNSKTIFKDTLTLNANLICGANAILTIDSSYVNSNMTYMGQYEIQGFDSGEINFKNSVFNLHDGKFGGGFRNNAGFYQYNNIYLTSIGIAMTLGFHNNTWLNANYCSGGIELIINDTATITLENSKTFILWFGFGSGDTVNIDFPATNPVYPPSSNVTSYSFSNTLPNVTGVNYNVDISNCNTVYWALMLDPGCSVVINNDSLLAVGLFYLGGIADTLNGFVNNLTYSNHEPSLADRKLILNNSLVFAWNFYPSDSTEIVIDDYTFGEILTFNKAKAEIINSTCDGSGGYFGSSENSKIVAKNSHIKRTYAGPPIVLNSHNSFSVFENCLVEGNIILNENSKLIHNNTKHNDSIILNQGSFFLNVSLDTIINAYTASTVNINGSLFDMKGILNTDIITGFKLFHLSADTLNITTIVDTAYSPSITHGLIYPWNTSGLTSGKYIIWLTVYINGDSLVTASRKVVLNDFVGIMDNSDKNGLFKVYPNPANRKFYILKKEDINDFEIQILDINGRVLINEQNKTSFNVDQLKSGIYIIRLIAKNEIENQILIKQ